MSIYYLVVRKQNVASKSGNLPPAAYGDMPIESLPFIGKVEFDKDADTRGLNFFYKKPDVKGIGNDHIVIKVDINDQAMKETTLKKYQRTDCMRVIANLHDRTLTISRPENEVGLKISVISQVMDKSERYKHNAEMEEKAVHNPPKEKKGNPLRMAAISLAQKVIDYREKDIGKDLPESKPFRRL